MADITEINSINISLVCFFECPGCTQRNEEEFPFDFMAVCVVKMTMMMMMVMVVFYRRASAPE